jgi:hypothetical protein
VPRTGQAISGAVLVARLSHARTQQEGDGSRWMDGEEVGERRQAAAQPGDPAIPAPSAPLKRIAAHLEGSGEQCF